MYLSSNVRDRKFAGFAVSITTAPDSTTATSYDQGDYASPALGEESDGFAQINHSFRKDIYDLSNSLKQRTHFRWGTTSSDGTFTDIGSDNVHIHGQHLHAILSSSRRLPDRDQPDRDYDFYDGFYRLLQGHKQSPTSNVFNTFDK
jgi:hypothetical protein